MRSIEQLLLLSFLSLFLYGCSLGDADNGGECRGSMSVLYFDSSSEALFSYTGWDTIVLVHLNDTLHLIGSGKKYGNTESFTPAPGPDCGPNVGDQVIYQYYTITWNDPQKEQQLKLGHYMLKNPPAGYIPTIYDIVEVEFKGMLFYATESDLFYPQGRPSAYIEQLNLDGKIYNHVLKGYKDDRDPSSPFVYVNRENGIVGFSLNNNTETWAKIN